MYTSHIRSEPEMDHSRMGLIIRLLGWTLFLAGAGIMLVDTVAGLVVSGFGILCTMSCNLIANYAYLSKKKAEIEPFEPLDAEKAAKARQIIREKREHLIRKDAGNDGPRLEKDD